MSTHLVVFAVIAATLLHAPRAFADERGTAPVRTLSMTAPAGPIRTALDNVRFDSNADRPAKSGHETAAAQSPSRGNVWGRVVLASVGGTMGFFGGGVIGARIEGPCGGCDDPGFKGAIIGAPIGAVVGAIAGWKIAGLLD